MGFGEMIATKVFVSIGTVLALLPGRNVAFAPTQPRCMNIEPLVWKCATKIDKNIIASRKFPLSARDTIFSLNDDDDDTNEEVDAIDDDDISDIISSMMADENAESSSDAADVSTDSKKKKIGDSVREDNGVRPSIHPISINAIAEALKARATQAQSNAKDDDDDEAMHFRVSDTVDPLMVMVTAGQFASDAIQKRQESGEEDGMLLNQEEEQTLAGRIMGVIMRFDALEPELAERTGSADWVTQYDEWGSFGLLASESERASNEDNDDDDDDGLEQVHAKILDDPLFCMNRAECLLAIFLQEVEIPQLNKVNQTVPDGSEIDFLDEDRREVVLNRD